MSDYQSTNDCPSQILATGSYLPEQVVENREIEQRLELESGWIEKRTGVVRRRIASADQAVSDLAIAAGRSALECMTPKERQAIGTLILATSTPDHLLPPTAPKVAMELGLGKAAAFDMAVACSGFVYALQVADALVRANGREVMVIAANILSRRSNPDDVGTAAIFADGAGAVVVGRTKGDARIIDVELESDGSGWRDLLIPDGGTRHPFNQASLDQQRHLMKINNGMSVFRYAVEAMARMANVVLSRNGYEVTDVDLWVPHQANGRIVESTRTRVGFSTQQTCITLAEYGNSSAATIPISLDRYIQDGNDLAGKLVLFTAAGAGLTCGAALARM